MSVKITGFILLPLYSATFSVAEYGIIVRVEALWQILWAVFLFGYESGVIRWFTQIEDEVSKKKFLFSVTALLVLINLIFTIVIFVLSDTLSTLIFNENSYSNLILYSSLIATSEAILFLFLLLLRINEKAFVYALLTILSSILNLFLQYYFIQYTTFKLDGIFISKIISPVFIIVALIPYYVSFLMIGIDLKHLKEFISFCFPLMLGTFVFTLLNQSNRYILGFLTDSRDVGLFGLGSNICGIILFFIISPYNLAFTVLSWKKLSDENAKRYYTKSVTYFYYVILYFSIFVSLLTPHFIKILSNPDYWFSKDIVPWIALSLPFYGIQTIGIFSFYVTKRTKYILYFYIFTLFINIVLNFILIPYFSIYGAAIASFVSFLFLNIIVYFYSKKNYFFEYEWLKITVMTLTAILLMFPFFYFDIRSTFLTLSGKLLALLMFPLILYFLGFYERIEIETIKSFLRKYIRFRS